MAAPPPKAPAKKPPAPVDIDEEVEDIIDDFEVVEPPVEKPAAKAKAAPPPKTPAKKPPAPVDIDEEVEDIAEDFEEVPPVEKPAVKKAAGKRPPAPADDEVEEDEDDKPAKSKKPAKKKAKAPAVADLPDDLWEKCALLQHDRLMSKVKFSLFGASGRSPIGQPRRSWAWPRSWSPSGSSACAA